MEAIVLSWLDGSISFEILEIVMASDDTAPAAWTNIEGLFRDNKESRALYLKAEFRYLVQGDQSIFDYCRKQKNLTDSLGDVGQVISDKTLILNTLHGLNEKYAFMQKPFPTFIETRSALILEEIKGKNDASQATALIANTNHGASRTNSSNTNSDGHYNSNSGSGGNYSNNDCRSRRNRSNDGSGNGHNGGS